MNIINFLVGLSLQISESDFISSILYLFILPALVYCKAFFGLISRIFFLFQIPKPMSQLGPLKRSHSMSVKSVMPVHHYQKFNNSAPTAGRDEARSRTSSISSKSSPSPSPVSGRDLSGPSSFETPIHPELKSTKNRGLHHSQSIGGRLGSHLTSGPPVINKNLEPPSKFRVTRFVGKDGILLAWQPPDDPLTAGYKVRPHIGITYLTLYKTF
jgi:hypothetical protein